MERSKERIVGIAEVFETNIDMIFELSLFYRLFSPLDNEMINAPRGHKTIVWETMVLRRPKRSVDCSAYRGRVA